MAYQVITERSQKPRSGVALGGIGCGWFELRQDGQFYNWNIFNNAPHGLGAPFTQPRQSVLFFVLRIQVEGEEPCLKLLQIEESHDSAGISGHEFQYIFPWLQGMDRIEYSATFPFVKLEYSAADMPLEVSLEAWSPFIPRDSKNSALPVANFDFSIRSRSPRPMEVTLVASMRNWVGYDVREKAWANHIFEGKTFRGFEMSCTDQDPRHASFGSLAVASLHADSHYDCGWGHLHPYYENFLRQAPLPDTDNTSHRNAPDETTGRPWAKHHCFSSIGRTATLRAENDLLRHSFVVSWDFPNRYGRSSEQVEKLGSDNLPEDGTELAPTVKAPPFEGHYYSNFFTSASAVATYAIASREALLTETRRFHDAFFCSTLPSGVLDQVNSHLNTFRTSSWFTRSGDFGIIEGLSPTKAFAGLATTDVAMYGSVATAALFPDLEKASLRAHKRFQNENGSVLHSIHYNFHEKNPEDGNPLRLDLPSQYVFMTLRYFLWTGDRDYLLEAWPSVQAALDYVLRERDFNGDCLPDMEGIMCSYDNFPMYGVAPFVASQWLLALRTTVEVAGLLGDTEAGQKYQAAFEKGRTHFESACWNGDYYRLYHDVSGERGVNEGCLTDQIIGQWAAHLVSQAPLFEPARVKKALRSILRLNFRPSQGLRNCQWPNEPFLHDVAPDSWVDQANTCWTGVELAFASFLLYEEMPEQAFALIENVDARHRQWGIYWDHQEYGGHYFRPMSAWAFIHAALGLSISNGVITFDPKVPRLGCRLFFVTADCYGHYLETADGIALDILSGKLAARQLRFRGPEQRPADGWGIRIDGTPRSCTLDGEFCLVDPREQPAAMAAGKDLDVPALV